MTNMQNHTDTRLGSVERLDLLEALANHRGLLLRTASGVTDDQARMRSTVSELTIGGIIKHVAATEAQWAGFMIGGAPDDGIDWSDPDLAVLEAYRAEFRLGDDETLASVVDAYADVAAATDRLIAEIDDLDRSFPLPAAPWFAPGAEWTVRRTILHIIAETSQHAGHADIVRETIDGAKTMG